MTKVQQNLENQNKKLVAKLFSYLAGWKSTQLTDLYEDSDNLKYEQSKEF